MAPTAPPFPLPGPEAGAGVDLSLLSDAQLRAEIADNPWSERDRVAAGRPGEVGELASAFARAGGDFDLAQRYSVESQQLIGASFTNDGRPVYTVPTHLGRIPTSLPDAGTRLVDIARRLDTTADELQALIVAAGEQVDGHETAMRDLRETWRAEVDAARAPGLGGIPFDVLAGLQARREQLIEQQRSATRMLGGTMVTARAGYESTLHGVMRLLADIGYVPPDALDSGPGDDGFTPEAGASAAADVAAAVDAPPSAGTLGAIDAANRGVELLTAKVAAGGTLTEAEERYLAAYYDRLAATGTLPRLEGAAEAAAPLAYQSSQSGQPAIERTLGTVANGLMTLSQPDGGAHVPASVHALLDRRLGHEGRAAFGGYDGGRMRVPALTRDGWRVPGLAEYAGTAGLLSHATTDGGREFTRALGESALRARQDLNSPAIQARPEALTGLEDAPDQLLHVVGRDVEASQDIVGDTRTRDVLLGAGWDDGTGAASVLTTATKPVQATPELATRSAELTRTLFEDLGSDPTTWRELIPKSSDMSDAITELAASRIETFVIPRDSGPAVLDPVADPGGGYVATVRLNTQDAAADDRIDFLKFVATGTDLANPAGDQDVQRIRTAGDVHVRAELTDALRTGGNVAAPLRHHGELDGLVGTSQYRALLDQGALADEAAARIHADRTQAITLVERVAAASIAPGFGPLSSHVKDPFNVAFDNALAGAYSAPEPTAAPRAADLFDTNSNAYAEERAYLILTARNDAGQLDPAAHPELFRPDGSLRPLHDTADEAGIIGGPSGRPDGAHGTLLDLAATTPPGVTDWPGALDTADGQRDAYRPLDHTPADDPQTPLDDRERRHRIRYGHP